MTVAMAVGETTGLVQAKLKTNSRFPSPSWTTWSRTGRPSHCKRCRDLPFFLPIRESKMIALFLGAFLKGEIVKPASRPGSRFLSVLGTTMVILITVLSAPRTNLCCHSYTESLLGQQDWQVHNCSMQGDRPVRLCADVSHPCPQRHWHCLYSCAQETAAEGQY